MTDTIKQKMKQISEDLGELNRQGKVKRFGGEKGYAKVYQIIPGCSIFVHHSSDDSLVIDLQITVEAIGLKKTFLGLTSFFSGQNSPINV
jgi:hypothetical protein